MGTEGSNWRVVKPHGGQTRRAGALDRLVKGLGGWQGQCGERHLEQAQGHALTWPGEPRGVDGNIHTNWLALKVCMCGKGPPRILPLAPSTIVFRQRALRLQRHARSRAKVLSTRSPPAAPAGVLAWCSFSQGLFSLVAAAVSLSPAAARFFRPALSAACACTVSTVAAVGRSSSGT